MNTNKETNMMQEEEEDGTLDSLGIKYVGPVLEGLVTPMDAALRLTTRANPLDPFAVEESTWSEPG